jgi:hypothetical protein
MLVKALEPFRSTGRFSTKLCQKTMRIRGEFATVVLLPLSGVAQDTA